MKIWYQLGRANLIVAVVLATTALSLRLGDFSKEHISKNIIWINKETIYSEVLDRDRERVIYSKPIIIEFM